MTFPSLSHSLYQETAAVATTAMARARHPTNTSVQQATTVRRAPVTLSRAPPGPSLCQTMGAVLLTAPTVPQALTARVSPLT